MSPEQQKSRAAIRRRNWLIFGILIGLCVLIYLISIVQMSRAT